MKISKIYSTRKSNSEVYSDLIYEWEDDFSKNLNVSIYSYKKNTERLIRGIFYMFYKLKVVSMFNRIFSWNSRKTFTLVFELYPRRYYSFQVSSNKIPYIIDFDFRVNLDLFNAVYKNCELVLVSSLEAYNFLKSNECTLNIAHLPLSISDRHKIDASSITKKEFDLIVTRPNMVFMKYLELFAQEHPGFEYIIRKWEENAFYKNNVYYSNKRGILGEFSDRTSYFNLLKKTKIALYATPGYDEISKRFMNHVTPSLFEFISAGCRIIARYPPNKETEYFNLNKISPSVQDYAEFEGLLISYLNDNSTDYLDNSSEFLRNIYTSRQVTNLNYILTHLRK